MYMPMYSDMPVMQRLYRRTQIAGSMQLTIICLMYILVALPCNEFARQLARSTLTHSYDNISGCCLKESSLQCVHGACGQTVWVHQNTTLNTPKNILPKPTTGPQLVIEGVRLITKSMICFANKTYLDNEIVLIFMFI